MAFSSGFTGQRGSQTWAVRIDILAKLGFIKIAPGASGPRSFALILNPYFVIQKIKPQISADLYNALVARANAIGADDLNVSSPKASPSKTVRSKKRK
jgi:hypothetical protein